MTFLGAIALKGIGLAEKYTFSGLFIGYFVNKYLLNKLTILLFITIRMIYS